MTNIWKLGTPDNKQFKFGLVASGLYSISAVSLLATSAFLISRASQMPPILYLMVAVVGVRAFALGRATFRYAERIFSHDGVFRHLSALRPRLYAALTPFLSATANKASKGQDLDRVTSDVEELQNFPLRVLSPLLGNLFALITGTLLLATLSWQVALVLFISGLGFSLFGWWITTFQQQDLEKSRAETRATMRSGLVEYLDGISEFRNLGWAKDLRNQLSIQGLTQLKRDRRNALSVGLGPAIFGLAAILTIFLGAQFSYQAVSERIDGVYLAVLVLVPLAVFEVLTSIPAIAIALRKYSVAAERIQSTLEAKLPKELQIEQSNAILDEFSSLELVNLSVSYPNQQRFAVQGVNLKLVPGQILALMGKSGAGKTTVALAINSLIRPSTGEVLVNGTPLSEFTIDSRRRIIGLIEQQPHIFSGTLRQNLELVEGKSDIERWNAIRAVGLEQTFLARAGLDTELGQRGYLVSGGESQRIAIARALLADFKLLVVDEPTSALDEDNARKLAEDLREIAASKNLAILLITHDPEIANFCDEIMQL